MSKRGQQNQQNKSTQQTAKAEETQQQVVEGQDSQEEQSQDTQAPETTETKTVVTEEKPEEEAAKTEQLQQAAAEELALHEDLELKAFTQYLDEYAKRYELKPAQPKDDQQAHMRLHAAIRSLVRSEPKLQRAMFGALVNRIGGAKNGEFQLPTIVKHLTNPKMVQDKAERVFLGEFLTLMAKYGRMENKAGIHKEANVARVFESISDQDVAKRLMDLFPAK